MKVNKEFGSVIILPEVSLSPKNGPEERVGTMVNRISQYVMARMMTEPEVNWKEIIEDYCEYKKTGKYMLSAPVNGNWNVLNAYHYEERN